MELRDASMTPDEIMAQIDAKRTRQRELSKAAWIAPAHIVEAIAPERDALETEIHDLKAQLFRANGGSIDHTLNISDLTAGE